MSPSHLTMEVSPEARRFVQALALQPTIELTQHGEPVTVLLSIAEYQRLVQQRRDFWSAYTTFCSHYQADDSACGLDLHIERDPSSGREIECRPPHEFQFTRKQREHMVWYYPSDNRVSSESEEV